MADLENTFPQLAQWYVQSLETINLTFQTPLTLLQKAKLERLDSLKKQSHFPERWNRFKSHPEEEDAYANVLVLDVLSLLMWNSSYILNNVGKSTADHKLPFGYDAFLHVEQQVFTMPPFKTCVPGPTVLFPISAPLVKTCISSFQAQKHCHL